MICPNQRPRHAATSIDNQPMMKATPPNGVIAPVQRGAPSASAYKLPQNSTIPIANALAAIDSGFERTWVNAAPSPIQIDAPNSQMIAQCMRCEGT